MYGTICNALMLIKQYFFGAIPTTHSCTITNFKLHFLRLFINKMEVHVRIVNEKCFDMQGKFIRIGYSLLNNKEVIFKMKRNHQQFHIYVRRLA